MNNQKIKIVSVNISEKKGTIKKPVSSIELYENGIKKDAHSGSWHRQVSMLAVESFRRFEKDAKRKIEYGEFAENITTEGIELVNTKPGDIFKNKDIKLEVTQIGKECHGSSCAIFREVGKCVMPKEGIFCRVIKGEELKVGDSLEYFPLIHKVKVITLSDRASRGEYEDRSGPVLQKELQAFFEKIGWRFQIERHIIPDNEKMLEDLLQKAKEDNVGFLFTTGGTGISKSDITVDTVSKHIDKDIPGIMEMIRMKYGAQKPNALLSRGVAGVMENTFVYTLPGSVKAIKEYTNEIFKTLEHLYYMLHNIDVH